MNIIAVGSKREGGEVGARIISDLIKRKPNAVLGLATGSSPEELYEELVRTYLSGEISFSGVRSVNLDEYVGLGENDEQSYRYYMRTRLFSRVDISPENAHVPNGLSEDIAAECKRYDGLIRSLGGVDLQLLGIGRNGHIGFNEPSEKFSCGTHTVSLSDSTVAANARFFGSEALVPREAITMGAEQIIEADRILLLAFGKEKSSALYDALYGDVTPRCPASILQRCKKLTVIADADALS